MSDERDSAGSAGDGKDTADTGGQTAVVTQPARPTGKRSRTRAADSDAESTGDTKTDGSKNGGGSKPKTAKKSPGSGEPGRNPVVYVWTFLQQVVAELRKVIWPNRKQMVNYTTVVLIFLAFMVALIGVVDLGLARAIVFVFGE